MPRFEEAVDTPEEIHEHGLIPILVPGGSYFRDFFDKSPIPLYQEIGKDAIQAKDWTDWCNLVKELVLKRNTHVVVSSDLACGFLYADFIASRIDAIPPWYVWIINKKWQLKEELAKHIMKFQQVLGRRDIFTDISHPFKKGDIFK